MDFELSEDQKLLVDTVQSFVKRDSPVERMRKLRDHDVGWEKQVWQRMGELGWLGVMFPESAGGLGLAFQDAALVVEQLGMSLVPEPYLPLIVAGVPLSQLGSSEQHDRFLAPVLAGQASLALAYAEEASRNDVTRITTRAEKQGSSYKLTGAKSFVLNGHAADTLIVSARTSGGDAERNGISLFVLDRHAPGINVQTIQMMDGKKGAMVRLDGAEAPADRLLGTEGQAADVLELALDYGAAAACAEGAGIMQTVLKMTRDYLAERKQFGKPIGSFQALQHRAVDMFVETELSRSTAVMAMIQVEAKDPALRKRAVSAAKVQLAKSGGFVTRQGIQLHGGIGVTDEHDVGLFFKRMHSLNTLFGDEMFHTHRFASLPSFTKHVS
jgi:alkylation response protein AidB-like acyl-CoA dehydrogenase